MLQRVILLCPILIVFFAKAQEPVQLKMWYNKPAAVWNEALPIGNGRLAAMIFGDPVNERIQLNESTFWSGGPSCNDNPDALSALSDIRQLIFDGKYIQAENMINQKITAKQLHGSMYQPVGYLNISFPEHTNYTDYYRELNLENAIFTTTYKVGAITYKREVFASQPDQVIVIRLSASRPKSITFSVSLNGPLQTKMKTIDHNTLELTGLSSTHEGITGQVKFNARAKILNVGGSATIGSDKIDVIKANEVIILVSIATNFVDYKTLTANETELSQHYISLAETKKYSTLLNRHVAAYQRYFNRLSINLGISSQSDFPTDVRIKSFSQTKDPELVALYYQFGRYLLISCSQPGGQPATLQGLWNDRINPPWDSKYTININTEMNYWLAEKCNLSEMHEPLIRMIKELSESGQKTAGEMYGCRGWVVHHNTDLWRISGVVDGAFWGMWPMGGAWLSQHLWEKFLYNGDLEYLNAVYPVMKAACEFYQDFLIEEPNHHWLVVCPSISPENAPMGHHTSISAGTTIDNQILFDLFSKTIKAASLLKRDSALMIDFQKILDCLPPMQIGRFGQLQEWLEDWDNPDDQHRHVSHLYGLFPSNQISPFSSPELFEAARTSLIYRGDVSTGWSMGWKVNLWARLLDGNHALKLITDQLSLVDPRNPVTGGTFPNFFDSHPPFQIDGNFGCTSGITEMLMQSHDGAIYFLPALPDEWKSGRITGLRAYGGFEVDFEWENGQIQKIKIISKLGGNCRIRVANELAFEDGTTLPLASGPNPNPFFSTPKIRDYLIKDSTKIKQLTLQPTYLYDLSTQPGKTYNLINKNKLTFKETSKNNKNIKLIVLSFIEPFKKKTELKGFTVKSDTGVIKINNNTLGDKIIQSRINLKKCISEGSKDYPSSNNRNLYTALFPNSNKYSDILLFNNLAFNNTPLLIREKKNFNNTILLTQLNNFFFKLSEKNY